MVRDLLWRGESAPHTTVERKEGKCWAGGEEALRPQAPGPQLAGLRLQASGSMGDRCFGDTSSA